VLAGIHIKAEDEAEARLQACFFFCLMKQTFSFSGGRALSKTLLQPTHRRVLFELTFSRFRLIRPSATEYPASFISCYLDGDFSPMRQTRRPNDVTKLSCTGSHVANNRYNLVFIQGAHSYVCWFFTHDVRFP
jgi:hypothetical protein